MLKGETLIINKRFLKRNGAYTYMDAQEFLGMKKGLWDLHSQGGPFSFGKGDRDESSSIA